MVVEFRVRVDGAGGGDTSGQQEPTEATESRETVDLRSSEMLCAVCLTKRFAHRCALAEEFGLDWTRPDQRVKFRFPSVASIASAPFRSRLAKRSSDQAVDAVDQWHSAVRRRPSAVEVLPAWQPGPRTR